MKTYYDYIDELSAEELRKGLLGHGMFADKLPDFLTAEKFYEYCDNSHYALKFTSKMGWDYIRYDSMRNTSVPRALGIPTPFAYYNLCICIANNWSHIKQHFQDKTLHEKFKRSQVHIQKRTNGFHLFEMSTNYKDVDNDTIEFIQKQPIAKFYKVETDISSCFPSIYSHALSWALVGKQIAKTNKDTTLWYNQLDECSRKIKYNETCGLLIGPHTSNLLSEIILTTVDDELSTYDYVRYIDDITFYAESEEQAEKFILDLVGALKKYELALNTKKTRITRLPLSFDNDWKNALTSFYMGEDKTDDGKKLLRYARLKAYLDLAVNLVNSTGNASIFTYVLKVVSSYVLGKKALNYYIDMMHHLLLLYPYLVHWYDKYIFAVFNVNVDKIKEIAINLYELNIKKRNYEACSFALSWAIKYNFNLDGINILDYVIHSEDCILLLLTFLKLNHMRDKVAQKTLKDIAEKYLKNGDMDRYWLFIYEVLPQSSLQGEYKVLKKQNITFLKAEYQKKIK